MVDARALDDTPVPSTRQLLSKRQSATVDALLDAALAAIRESGYESLSLRNIAIRAGVTHTTAYTYFTSKEHLVAELNWRLLRQLPTPEHDATIPVGVRLIEALRGASEMFASEPALAEAVLASMVALDPEVERIRDSIGAEVARRIGVAVGSDADPRLLDGALLLFSGAMLQAGLGYFAFNDVVDRIGVIAELWDKN